MTCESILTQARSEHRTLLKEIESKQLLQEAGVSVTNTELAINPENARVHADRIGYPVVLKIVSPDIVHKSAVGGVRVGLEDAEAVTAAFDEIIASAKSAVPDAGITGVAVQNMVPEGTEVIVGMTTDPQFGPVMMFGLGGIMVEILKDVSFRLVPLTERDAAQMVKEIKGDTLLNGVRGKPPADKAALCRAILNVAGFIEQHPEIKELDLNPMIAYPNGAIAVDARIVLGEN